MLDQFHAHFEDGPFAGLPRGYFRVAHVDPPWTFHAWSHRGDGKGACQHYRCQSLEDIIALPVDQLMAPDAALFLWVVQPMLPEALQVIRAWGFEYRTVAFVWNKMPASWSADQLPLRIKPRMGLGYHTRSGTEQCWLALRGKGYVGGHSSAHAARSIVNADFHAKDLVDALFDGLHIAGKEFGLLVDLLDRAVEDLVGEGVHADLGLLA